MHIYTREKHFHLFAFHSISILSCLATMDIHRLPITFSFWQKKKYVCVRNMAHKINHPTHLRAKMLSFSQDYADFFEVSIFVDISPSPQGESMCFADKCYGRESSWAAATPACTGAVTVTLPAKEQLEKNIPWQRMCHFSLMSASSCSATSVS